MVWRKRLWRNQKKQQLILGKKKSKEFIKRKRPERRKKKGFFTGGKGWSLFLQEGGGRNHSAGANSGDLGRGFPERQVREDPPAIKKSLLEERHW